jgi:hypothetical protein
MKYLLRTLGCSICVTAETNCAMNVLTHLEKGKVAGSGGSKNGISPAAIPLKEGFSRIDFFSNHGREVNGYKHYLSSPYTRVELRPSRH